MESFLAKLEIPENCALNKRVFKKLFEENAKLDATDKKALKDDVQEIRWLYTLKPATINIPRYSDDVRDYPEIAILQVSLSSPARIKRLSALMQKAIPYPLILLFTHENSLSISLADKRVNQADKSKLVVEATIETGLINLRHPTAVQRQFLDDLSLKKLSFINFYAMYQDIFQRVVALNCAYLNGRYELKRENQENRVVILREIQTLEQAQAELLSKLKREKQMGRQVDLNGQIHKIASQMEKMKEAL